MSLRHEAMASTVSYFPRQFPEKYWDLFMFLLVLTGFNTSILTIIM